jgi:hypothetical protein
VSILVVEPQSGSKVLRGVAAHDEPLALWHQRRQVSQAKRVVMIMTLEGRPRRGVGL